MPGVNSVQISLSDALQVNGKPLHEEQLWSVLCQSTEAIQDVFLKGNAEGKIIEINYVMECLSTASFITTFFLMVILQDEMTRNIANCINGSIEVVVI